MRNFPIFNSLKVNAPDGYLNSMYWNGNILTRLVKGIIIDEWALLPSLTNDILYIDSIVAKTTRVQLEDTGEWNNIKSSQLFVKTNNDIEILLEPITVDVAVDDTTAQEAIFIDDRTPLFRIKDLTRKQTFIIVFYIVNIDSYDNKITTRIFYNFTYNISTMLGDVNGDGQINLLDVVALSDYVNMGKDIAYPHAGDINQDGNIDMLDVVELSNMVLNG